MSEERKRNTGVGLDHWGDAFPDTHWTLLLKKEGVDSESESTMEQRFSALCTSYWYPVYAYLRKRGHNSHDAQDHTQGFFAYLLDRNRMVNPNPNLGRFRSYLLGALNHYLADHRKYRQAQKRGGGQTPLSIDEQDAEGRLQDHLRDDITPERQFDRQWAVKILNESKALLEQDFISQGRAAIFSEVVEFLTCPPAKGGYREIAIRLGLSEDNLRAIVSRMRKSYKHILRKQILVTVSSEDEIDKEIRYLFNAIG